MLGGEVPGWVGCAGAQGGGGSEGFGETGAPTGKRENEEGRVNRPQRQQPPCGMRFLGSQPASSQGGA